MKIDFESGKPIFQQIAEQIEDAIFIGAFEEGAQIPSTTEVSTTFQINPATVLKGMNQLMEEGILYKKRGVGVFVCEGAKNQIVGKRKEKFYENYVESLITEAKKLELTKQDIMELIERGLAK